MPRPEPITLWGLLHEAHAAVTVAAEEDVVVALDLPWTWFEVLIRLDRSGGTLSHDALVRQLQHLSGGPASLLGRIGDAGYLHTHGGDGAGALQVSLSPEGRDVIGRAVEVHLATLERCVMGLFTDAELVFLEGVVRRIRDHNHPDAV